MTIVEKRILPLNKSETLNGDCVVYFVSRDIRLKDNFALIAAQQKAIDLRKPLVVCFALDVSIKSRSREHFDFMLNGLQEFSNNLNQLNISFVLKIASRQVAYTEIIKKLKPAAIYFDFSPLNKARLIQHSIAKKFNIPTFVVDAHNIIPVWLLSDKEEFAAHSIRFKFNKLLGNYLLEPQTIKEHKYEFLEKPQSKNFAEAKKALEKMTKSGIKVDFNAGESSATTQLNKAIKNIQIYASNRNDPNANAQTNLSPYLHYGFISSLRVVLELMKIMKEPPLLTLQPKLARFNGDTPSIDGSCNVLIEEIVVRKELADNYCFYNRNYNNIAGAKPWALASLTQAEADAREHIYSTHELEDAQTIDQAWNAAQNEMKQTGKMHGYMRMYWAKKILEWSTSPEQAIKTAIYLNDKYSIDGGDPNGYTGMAWSIMGIHDRPWFERPIFGKIRYMNYAGLKKKFNVDEYQNKWNNS
jgi:deoxyribodipyrimidine photo-lyase